MTNKILIVLGMHRSGTSMVAEAVKECGFHVSQDLLETNSAINARGFWEDRFVVELNENLFSLTNSAWFDIRSLPENWLELPEVKALAQEAISYIQKNYGAARQSLIKDPRLCRLLPFWMKVFAETNHEVSALVVLRSPEFIAKSLKKRDSLPTDYSLLLWLRYMSELIEHIGQTNFACVDYDQVLENPEKILTEVLHRLNFEDVEIPSLSHIANKSLRHFDQNLKEKSEGNIELAAKDFHAKLKTEELQAPLKNWDKDLDLESLFELAVLFMKSCSDSVRVGELHTQALRTIDEKDKNTERLATELENASSLIKQRDAELTAVNKVRDEITRQFNHAEKLVKERDLQLTELNKALSDSSAELSYAQKIVEQRDAELKELSELYNHAESVVIERDLQLEKAESEYKILNNRIRNSFFGRLALRLNKPQDK